VDLLADLAATEHHHIIDNQQKLQTKEAADNLFKL